MPTYHSNLRDTDLHPPLGINVADGTDRALLLPANKADAMDWQWSDASVLINVDSTTGSELVTLRSRGELVLIGDPITLGGVVALHSLDDTAEAARTKANGELWYNSTDGKLRGYEGGAVVDLVGVAGGGSLDASYDYGGAGAGRSIVADTGPVLIRAPNTADANPDLLQLHADDILDDVALHFTCGSDAGAPNGDWRIGMANSGYAFCVSPGTFASNVWALNISEALAWGFRIHSASSGAFVVTDTDGDDWIQVRTHGSYNDILFGDATINPAYSFVGTGLITLGGALVVGSKAADPTGANGMIYYDSASNHFRVYENGAWRNMG